jgi:DUF917 family protein
MKLRIEDIEDYARGAAFLGTGGGGDPHIGRLFCENAMRTYGIPEVVDLADLPDDANVYTIAMMGAPTVIVEKLFCGDDAELALANLEARMGKKATHMLACEIGGINSTLPIAMAAKRGIPVINADGMGRAFPEIQMVTFNVYGVPITPMVMTNDQMESVLIETSSAKSAEDIGRAVAMRMGLAVMLSAYPMSGADAKRAAVGGTVELALGIGQAIKRGRHGGDPVEELLKYLKTTPYYNHCGLLFDGKIVDLERQITRGFSMGRCVIDALDHSGKRMEVIFQNENLVALEDGRVKCIVPDLVVMVDRETAEPITTENLKYGQRVKVLGVSAPPMMRTRAALDCFGPHAFGLKEKFRPVEELLG